MPFAFQYYSTVADRYAYFAMLAPALAFAGILSLVPWRAAAAAGAVILFCLGWLAVRQIPVWAGTTALFTQALKANPDSFVSYSFLGGDLDEAGNFDQAIADYRKGIALNPKNWILQSGLGQALFQKWVIDGSRPQEIGLLQEAEQHFLATLAINGGYWQAHQNLGKIYDRMGRYKEALTQFQAAAKDAPNDPENNYMLALAYSRLGDMTDAEPLMQRAAAMGYAPAVQALAPQAPP